MGSIDRSLFEWLNGWDGGSAVDAVASTIAVSALGAIAGAVALVALVLWRRDATSFRLAASVLVAVALADVVTGKLLKPNVARVRPCHRWADTVRLHGTTCGGEMGFPSSHAANNAAITAALFGVAPRAVVAAFATFTAVVAWSRVYVGAHFPGDVIAGVVVGALFGWLARRVVFKVCSAGKRSVKSAG